ncbi:MAG TPA: lamin tail domain-containing protein [Polyangiales bacterium]|nr:lamin tail domain-containing protein [Polyangiales bacterium]
MTQTDTTRARIALICVFTISILTSCQPDPEPAGSDDGALVINELMSDNDAAWIDEAGEVGDYIEIANISAKPVKLRNYALRGSSGRAFEFPDVELAPGGFVVVFADDDEDQGPLHASWKLSSQGEKVQLFERASGHVVDDVELPALGLNETFSRFPSGTGEMKVCRYATPESDNGDSCSPPAPLELPDDSAWAKFTWPAGWPNAKGPLVLSELALHPARFIEVLNIGSDPVELEGYSLRLHTTGPGMPWPTATEGDELRWPEPNTLAPGERVVVMVPEAATSSIEVDPAFEGVATLFAADGSVVDRVDFMRWPEGAVLSRWPESSQKLRFCSTASEGAANDTACDPLQSRDVGDRVRHLYTPGDYAALAEGETNLGLQGVKFILDLATGDAVHLLSTRAWALHYTFIREKIDHQPPLDRCDAAQNELFYSGWSAFSEREYVQVATRRYLLGTLDRYSGSDLRTLDFALGDQITAPQMLRAFYGAMLHLDAEPVDAWSLHPAEPRQITELRKIEGQAPIVSSNAPFRNLKYQPLTEGVAFGTLRFVPATEIDTAQLGQDVIIVTDAVPNDLPFVSGLITEAFQTPLAHVNVLSQNRGTPNMALRKARADERISPLLNELVRLEVSSAGFTLRKATAAEVDAFVQMRTPTGPRIAPRLDTSVRGVVDLGARGLADLPAIGAKAAQLAEMGRIQATGANCVGPIPVPDHSFAIPLVHYLEHFERSGAKAELEAAMQRPEFRVDLRERGAALAKVRQKILDTPVELALMSEIEQAILTRWGRARLRFRSSSNTEDLSGFNGAGLYESLPAEIGDSERPIEGALRETWASLWNTRAYDEREFGHIDQSQVAMGVLVHPSFKSERANVIAISRDVLDPTRADIHYLNAQQGEASVANPAPGVTTEQLIHHWRVVPNTPVIEYQAKSSLTHGADVLNINDVLQIACRLRAVHDHFQALLDPQYQNRWFAMDVEIKIVGDARQVVFKQARPYTFGRAMRPADCREF